MRKQFVLFVGLIGLLWGSWGWAENEKPQPQAAEESQEKVKELVGKLSSENAEEVGKVISQLVKLKASSAIPEMVKLLEHPKPQIRGYAIWGLGRLGDSSICPKLVTCSTRETDTGCKGNLATALLYLGDKTAIELLIGYLQEKDKQTQKGAIAYLRKYTGESSTFNPDDPPEKQIEPITKWKKWWEANKNAFDFDLWEIQSCSGKPSFSTNERFPMRGRFKESLKVASVDEEYDHIKKQPKCECGKNFTPSGQLLIQKDQEKCDVIVTFCNGCHKRKEFVFNVTELMDKYDPCIGPAIKSPEEAMTWAKQQRCKCGSDFASFTEPVIVGPKEVPQAQKRYCRIGAKCVKCKKETDFLCPITKKD